LFAEFVLRPVLSEAMKQPASNRSAHRLPEDSDLALATRVILRAMTIFVVIIMINFASKPSVTNYRFH
jgi:hypothetical protein